MKEKPLENFLKKLCFIILYHFKLMMKLIVKGLIIDNVTKIKVLSNKRFVDSKQWWSW